MKVRLVVLVLVVLLGVALSVGCSSSNAAIPVTATNVPADSVSLDLTQVVMGEGVAFIPLDLDGQVNDPVNARKIVSLIDQFASQGYEVISWSLITQQEAYVTTARIQGICIAYK